jgi:Tfp pilus assembly protein PilF
MHDIPLTRWKITGTISTLVIVLSIPFYLTKERVISRTGPKIASRAAAGFAGSSECRSCHKPEYDRWRNSHHRFAMAVADEKTVLGDFDDAVFEKNGMTSKFYRKDEKFFVRTAGAGGEMGEFEITHTLGWHPLQQYLVPFPGGRLQCLPIAWDTRKKNWYHLYPQEMLDPDDWLYWTNQGQNWNGMCAECHSTNLKKNYRVDTDIYGTTWSEISVGCEACHGPGADHVKWAELPEMGRPPTENHALKVRTADLSSRKQVELCAPCHSRRMSLGDNPHANLDFLDYAAPQLLTEGYYFADGQILEEVYVYGSFIQSKMYDREVRCSDCHDVHSVKRVLEGNTLCLQCHKAAIYDTRDHHFHKKKGEKGEPIRSADGEVLFEVGSGALCEQCHMPGRIYMGVDYRPDHSFRIPRPDLSPAIDAPNACNRCHADKTVQWSVKTLADWYGKRRRPHYGTTLDAGRKRSPEALSLLIRLAEDRLYPDIVRATALSMAASFPGEENEAAFKRALADESALMRYTALRYLPERNPVRWVPFAAPLLYDKVKAVRIESARFLAKFRARLLPAALRSRFQTVLAEYRRTMEHTADFAPSRHNLGNLYSDLGQDQQAIENYRKAIRIDREFYPAKVNLAMVYNRLGKNERAEKLLRDVVAAHPDLYEVKYSLGLLLAEMKKYEPAVTYLEKAGEGLPRRSRIYYNLGLLLQKLKRDKAAETALNKALSIEPARPEYLYTAAVFYLQRHRLEEAQQLAERMVENPTSRAVGYRLLKTIENQRASEH